MKLPSCVEALARLASKAGLLVVAAVLLLQGLSDAAPPRAMTRTIVVPERERQATRNRGGDRLLPEYKSGKPHGMRVLHVAAHSILFLCGVRDGDVIVSMNGRVVVAPEDCLAAHRMLFESREVSMVLERGGSVMRVKTVFRP